MLHAMGLDAGSRLTIVADVDPSVVIAYLGALRLGAVVTLADPSSTDHELAKLISATEPRAALATGSSLAALAGGRPDCPVYGLKGTDRDLVAEILGDHTAGDPSPEVADPEAEAILTFTSGTTGEPKPVPLSHRNLLSSIRGAAAAWRWTAHDRLVHSLPIGHQHGLGGIHISLLTGSQTVVLPGFDPELLIDALHAQRASVLFAVPSIYHRLVNELPREVASLSDLRLMISGSAPLPVTLALRIEELSGQLAVERYGSTETGLNVSNPYDGQRVPGTVGLPLPGVEVALVGTADAVVEPGETGEVVVRGPQVFRGYPSLADEDRPLFVHDWFRTGDIGKIDPESGHLQLVARAKEIIITGGMNVHPREVETALMTIPGVVDVAVIGTPSEQWGEAVTAFVVMKGVSTTGLAAALHLTLAPYKRPKQIVEVTAIPRDDMGKVRRDLLTGSATPTEP